MREIQVLFFHGGTQQNSSFPVGRPTLVRTLPIRPPTLRRQRRHVERHGQQHERVRTAIQATGRGVFTMKNFAGIRATIIRDVIFSFTLFFVLENLHRTLEDLGKWKARTLSILAGSVAAVVTTQPFDVLKTKLQARPCCYGDYEARPFQALRDIAQTEGTWELTRGLGARALKLVPGVLVYLSIYEYTKSLLA